MELCQGESIVNYCDKQRLSIRERLELFAQVCPAVQHAHTKGVIHRDIKPSNILVATQDGKPHAKVIDFGIAKATNSKLTERTVFTEHRQLVGTLEYMSPEQAEGNGDIDTRTDVYSLGVLLYELLTGTTPIGSLDLRSVGYREIQRMIVEVDPPSPSTRLSKSVDSSVAAARRSEPRKLRAFVRGELDWIVMKALEKDRRRRYETANSLALDVRRYLGGEAVVAAPPHKLYQFRKFVRRHKAVAGTAAVLLVAMIGLAAALFAVNRERMRAENALASEAVARKRTRQALDDMTSQVMENWMARQQKLDPSQKRFLEKALASYEGFAQESGGDSESRPGGCHCLQTRGPNLLHTGSFGCG
jgi:serine/threonine protein kinase